MVRIQRDMGKVEELLAQPGDLKVVATIRFLRKGNHLIFELESDEGISRRLVKKTLRRASLEL
jgi:hypothetical protein